MHRLLAATLVLGLSAPASAERDKPIDVSDLRPNMSVFHDGKGHYLVIHKVEKNKRWQHKFFYGTGRRFHPMNVFANNTRPNGDFSVQFKDPRYVAVSLVRKDGKVTAKCRRTRDESSISSTNLSELPDKAANKLLARAKFYKPPFKRTPHALGRDTMGVYYYIDHRSIEGRMGTRRDYHLYIGVPGSMKRQRLVSVADDSVGQVFATKKGALQVRWGRRGNRNRAEVFAWIKPNRKDRIELTNVPARINELVIFETLQVYGAVRYGTHCDDL